MIKNLITHFQQLNNFVKTALFLLLFAISFSCTDQGCIDADDFGEYESETIEVTSNSSQDACSYDASKPLDDQGSNVKQCLTMDAQSVTDENNVTKTVDAGKGGCNGFTEESFRQLCISQCVLNCTLTSISNSGNAEPKWTSTNARSTSQNRGVTILPGSQITINATNSISLGDTASYPNIFIQADNYFPHSKATNWTDLFFDVRNGQSLNVTFSGSWSNDSNNTFFGDKNNVGLSQSGGTDNDRSIYNGAKRLAAFTIPLPSGYDFDSSQSSELLGTKFVPLLPDRGLWQCKYSVPAGSTYAAADCDGGSYSSTYPHVDDAVTATTFSVNNSSKTNILSSYGGMIRWNNDGINPDNSDPFDANGVTCIIANNPACPNFDINKIPPTKGQLVGVATADIVISNPSQQDSYKVSFKNLSDTSCSLANVAFKIWVKDSGGNILDNGAIASGNLNARPITTVDAKGWSTDHIALEPGQSIVVKAFDNPSLVNCGKGIAVKFSKYHDLQIDRSGLVSFSMLSTAGTGNCTIKGRIINPNGSHSDATFNAGSALAGYSADFYEYGNFLNTTATDPLSNLTVSPATWTNPIFVRKGQKIRFSPESWNNTWNPSGFTAQCGTGMAMSITPRPALLCRGQKDDLVSNPACTPDYDTSSGSAVLIGCKAIAKECSDTTNATYYCPTACQKIITSCTNADPTKGIYAKTGCTASDNLTDAAKCTYTSAKTGVVASTANTCNNCAGLQVTNALKQLKVNISQSDQCYDLENYEGKVANIPTTSGNISAFISNKSSAKGATRLSTFNGVYGNFENFYESTKTGDTTHTYSLQSPMLFTQEGRLRFFLIDGDDFNGSTGVTNSSDVNSNAYSNNSLSGSSYSGSNGIKLGFSGLLSFNNGQWMEIRLCKESSGTSINCRNTSVSTYDPTDLTDKSVLLSTQPKIIEITPPTASTAGTSPTITTPYKFDGSGNLLRTQANNGSTDCTSTLPGVYFYCHTFDYFSETDLAKKTAKGQKKISDDAGQIRLSFKIIDPEVATCYSSADAKTRGVLDGVVLPNAFYNSVNTTNIGTTCDATVPEGAVGTGKCEKQYYCGNKYANNSGSYFVNIKVKNQNPSTVSSVIGKVITPIIQVLDGDGLTRDCSTTSIGSNDGVKTINNAASSDGAICTPQEMTQGCTKQYYCKAATNTGQAERIYKALISDSRYKAIVTMCFVVMITFYGVGFLMGVSELNHSEIINRILKIGLIYLFIGETGWDWFNAIVVHFFKNSTDYLAFMMASSFDNSANLQNAITNSDYYDKSVLFSSVDQVFNIFFSPSVQKKISALLFASIFGWLYMIIIYYSFCVYILAVANAILLYLTAQVFISILFTLGPIFFIFTLFSQTKDMFDNWLKQLIGFSLQQIFLLTTLAFFNMLMYEVIKLSLGYKICWEEVWSINIITHISLMSFWTIASLPPRTNSQSSVGNIGNPDGIPSLFSILFIYVIASLMNKFITFMTDVAASIGGGLKASEMGAGLKEAVGELSKAVQSKAEEAFKKAGGQDLIDRMDDKLFDSGKIADARREKAKADNKTQKAHKAAITKAGDKAVSDFRSSGKAAEFAGRPEALKEELAKVRAAAQTDEGAKRGLDQKGVDAALAHKNVHTGNNALASIANYANNARLERKAAKKDDSTFSAAEMKSALKNTDAAGREALKKAAANGDINVKRSTAGKILEAGAIASKAGGDARKATGGAIGYVGGKAASAAKSAGTSAATSLASAAKSTATALGTKEGRADTAAAIGKAGKAVISAPGAAAATIANAAEATGKVASAAGRSAVLAASAAPEVAGKVASAAASTAASAASSASQAVSSAGKAAASAAVTTGKALTGDAQAQADIKSAAVSAAKTAATPIRKAGEVASSAVTALKEATTSEAEKQLLEEGKIDHMRFGTAWADDDRAKAIRERAEVNKAEKASNIKKPDLGVLADMQREMTYLDKTDKISKDAPLLQQFMEHHAAASEHRDFFQSNKKANFAAAADAVQAGVSGQISKELKMLDGIPNKENPDKAVKGKIALNDDKIAGLKESLKPMNDKINAHPASRELNSLRADLAKKETPRSKKSELKKQIADLEEKNLDLVKLEKARDKSPLAGELKRAETTKKTLDEKRASLVKTKGLMDKAAAIKSSITGKTKATEQSAVGEKPAQQPKPTTENRGGATVNIAVNPTSSEEGNISQPEATIGEDTTASTPNNTTPEEGSSSQSASPTEERSAEGNISQPEATINEDTAANNTAATPNNAPTGEGSSTPQTTSPTEEKISERMETLQKEKAASVANPPKTALQKLGKAFAAATGRDADSKLKKLEALKASSKTAKADKFLAQADKILAHASKPQKAGSPPFTQTPLYKEAEQTRKAFNAINGPKDLDKFIEAGEERMQKIESEFGDLKTPKDFEKFNDKYEALSDEPETKEAKTEEAREAVKEGDKIATDDATPLNNAEEDNTAKEEKGEEKKKEKEKEKEKVAADETSTNNHPEVKPIDISGAEEIPQPATKTINDIDE